MAVGVFDFGSSRAVVLWLVIERFRDHEAAGMDRLLGEIPFRLDQAMTQAELPRLIAVTGWTQQSIDDGCAATVPCRGSRRA